MGPEYAAHLSPCPDLDRSTYLPCCQHPCHALSCLPSPPARPAGEHRYQELKAEAQLASRRALQAQEQEIQFVQQAHTALEHAQPQWAQQLEAEAQKVGRCSRRQCWLG